jgi:hypothetical protein
MSPKPRLVKVQLAAEFVIADGDFMQPGTFGPVEMTAREWAEFDLQAAIERGLSAQPPEPEAPERAAKRASRTKGVTRDV